MSEQNLIINMEVPAAVREEFLKGHHTRAALAEARQKRLARLNDKLRSRLMDGIGQLTMRVDSDVYFNMVRRFGPGCWRDKSFRDSFKKKNPGAAVKAAVHTGRIIRP